MVDPRSSRRSLANRGPLRALAPGLLVAFTCVVIIGFGAVPQAFAQCVSMNLDGDVMCALAESKVELLQTSPAAPVGYCDMVTNGVEGEAFNFEWATAGPGGAAGWTGVGTAEGSGYIWRWETVSQIHQLACGGINVPCVSFVNTGTQAQSGPFPVPGLTTTPGQVTASTESLTAGYLSFFSPPEEQLRIDSKVQQLQNGQFLIETRVRNLTSNRIVFEVADVAVNDSTTRRACGPDRMSCGGVCCAVDDCFIGADGFVCEATPGGACDGTTCGTECVDTNSNEQHCGACSMPCAPGSCCGGGSCVPCGFPGIFGTLDSGFLAPGSESVSCEVSTSPAKEVLTQLGAVCEPGALPTGTGNCALGPTGVRGMLNVFAPDESIVIAPDVGIFLTVSDVEVMDPNGNGFVEPGELVNLNIQIINAGPAGLTSVAATLSSPAVDLDSDGVLDNVVIPANFSLYPPVPGVLAVGGPMDCENYIPLMPIPSANTMPFSVLIPATHPVGTAREFVLQVIAQLNPGGGGAPMPVIVPVKFALAVTASVPIMQSGGRPKSRSKSSSATAAICPCDQVSSCDIAPSPCLLYFAFGNRERVVFSPVADTHDLMYGDLNDLRSSSGDYSDSNATLGCLASQTPFNFVDFPDNPADGQGFWFLARGEGGSYDTNEPSEVESRDGEIDLAAGHCPPP